MAFKRSGFDSPWLHHLNSCGISMGKHRGSTKCLLIEPTSSPSSVVQKLRRWGVGHQRVLMSAGKGDIKVTLGVVNLRKSASSPGDLDTVPPGYDFVIARHHGHRP